MNYKECPKQFIIYIINIYQRFFSPVLSKRISCRFYPTCSEYSKLCIKKYGVKIGLKKTINRLLRCRPDNFESCIDLP